MKLQNNKQKARQKIHKIFLNNKPVNAIKEEFAK